MLKFPKQQHHENKFSENKFSSNNIQLKQNKMKFGYFLVPFVLLVQCTRGIDLDINDKDSICSAASLIVDGMLDYYEGTRYGGTVGMFQSPYYWWEAGEAFGGILDFWYFCQNTTYEELIYDALISQRGSANDYIPANQSTTEGNDDQGVWGLTIIEAAERNFTNPTGDIPGWLAMSQAIFNTMWARWDTGTCGGGLRWQIFTWNSGYDYKNTISTACMMTMAARIGRYTGNETYFEHANKAYEWLQDIGFIVDNSGSTSVYDGSGVSNNCTVVNVNEWTYNYAVLMSGCAYIYNATGDSTWLQRTQDLFEGSQIFFIDDIMYEKTCQPSNKCTTDQRSFKSLFSRSLGQVAKLVPSLTDDAMKLIQASAEGAAKSCTGGTDGHTCGLNWQLGYCDAMYGLGEQMCALEIIQNLLVLDRPAPYTNETGGSSVGDASLGSNVNGTQAISEYDITITGKDKAGSGVITAFVLAALVGGCVWMVI